MPARPTTICLICISVAIAVPAHAQHETDGLREAPRALANGPTALPVEAEPEVVNPAAVDAHADPAIDDQAATAPLEEERAATQPARQSETITPLFGALRGSAREASESLTPTAKRSGGWGAARTLGALAIVIGLVLVLRSAAKWLAARAPSLGSQLTAGGRAPSGLLEVLGRYPVARGQKLVLLRLDRRVLLLSQTTAGFATLAELTDPEEVASILTKACDEEGASMASKFTSVLRSLERDPEIAPQGDVINVDDAPHPRSVRFAMQQQERDDLIIEPKIAPRSGTDALTDRLRSMRERWA